jgi:hypothetical protein
MSWDLRHIVSGTPLDHPDQEGGESPDLPPHFAPFPQRFHKAIWVTSEPLYLSPNNCGQMALGLCKPVETAKT